MPENTGGARLELLDNEGARALAGGQSQNLKLIEKKLGEFRPTPRFS